MTRKERLLAAIRRGAVDRVPYATYNIHPYSDNDHTRDASYCEIMEQIETNVGVVIKVSSVGAGVGLSRPAEGVVDTVTEINGEERIVTTTIHTPKGDLKSEYRNYLNKPGLMMKHLIADDEDIEKYMSLPYEPPEYDLSNAFSLHKSVGDRGIILLGFDDPMYQMASLFHYEDFCIRTLTDLPSIKRMVDWAFERSLENMKLVVAASGDMDCVFHTSGPELCTPPMIPPSVFAELVTPYMRQLVEVAHKAGKLAAIHCHGRVRQVFEQMIETGADMLEPIEPPPQGDISLSELLNQASGAICLMGHVQDQDFYSAPEGYFTTWVKGIAKTVGGRTGYIMSPTCTPFDIPCTDTYKRNYMEWLTAAEAML
ncbi:MAG: uroporphyrinogen decarboxylase family protein [Armatimonadota bacterium]|nr:uroporphyrinogen decarboxylase family protein [Armatimonadota bacterium]